MPRIILIALAFAPALLAQGTLADYRRAEALQSKAPDLVVNSPGPATFIANSHRFWYPRNVSGGTEFILADADSATRKPAFDHDKLAAAISAATGKPCTGLTLPFAAPRAPAPRPPANSSAPLTFLDNETALQFGTAGVLYRCSLTAYTCQKTGPIPAPAQRNPAPEDFSPEGPGGDPADGLEYQPPSRLPRKMAMKGVMDAPNAPARNAIRPLPTPSRAPPAPASATSSPNRRRRIPALRSMACSKPSSRTSTSI